MNVALYKEVEDLAYKRQSHIGRYHLMDTIQSNEVEDMVPQHPPPLSRLVSTMEIYANSCSCRICFLN